MTGSDSRSLTPAERAEDVPRITRALRAAVQEALRRHKLDGHPVAVWRDGRVVWIPAKDIPSPASQQSADSD